MTEDNKYSTLKSNLKNLIGVPNDGPNDRESLGAVTFSNLYSNMIIRPSESGGYTPKQSSTFLRKPSIKLKGKINLGIGDFEICNNYIDSGYDEDEEEDELEERDQDDFSMDDSPSAPTSSPRLSKLSSKKFGEMSKFELVEDLSDSNAALEEEKQNYNFCDLDL